VTDSANVALVRSICTPLACGDYTATGWADPEIECVRADGPEPGTSKGVAGLGEIFRDWFRAFEDVRFEATEYRELDLQRVLVLGHYSGRGRTSGLEVGQVWSDTAAVFHMRRRKVTKLILYLDRDRAFADLGLAPEGDAA